MKSRRTFAKGHRPLLDEHSYASTVALEVFGDSCNKHGSALIAHMYLTRRFGVSRLSNGELWQFNVAPGIWMDILPSPKPLRYAFTFTVSLELFERTCVNDRAAINTIVKAMRNSMRNMLRPIEFEGLHFNILGYVE